MNRLNWILSRTQNYCHVLLATPSHMPYSPPPLQQLGPMYRAFPDSASHQVSQPCYTPRHQALPVQDSALKSAQSNYTSKTLMTSLSTWTLSAMGLSQLTIHAHPGSDSPCTHPQPRGSTSLWVCTKAQLCPDYQLPCAAQGLGCHQICPSIL